MVPRTKIFFCFILSTFLAPLTAFGQKPEIFVQTGHSSAVNSLAFSVDGSTLVSASADGTIRVWDANSGRELRKITRAGASFTTVALSPDGKTIAASNSEAIRTWDLTTGKQLKTIRQLKTVEAANVMTLAFSPDSKTLVGANLSGDVITVDARTGAELRSFMVESLGGVSRQIALSLDGQLLAVALEAAGDPKGNIVRIYDVGTGRTLRILKLTDDFSPYAHDLGGLAFSPNNKLLATALSVRRVWDVATGQQLDEVPDSHSSSVAFGWDNKTLASDAGNAPYLWDVEGRTQLPGLADPTNPRFRTSGPITFSPDGKKIAAGSAGDGAITVWDIPSAKQVFTVGGAPLYPVSFNANGMLRAFEYDNLNVWDIATGKSLRGYSWYAGSTSRYMMTKSDRYNFSTEVRFSEDGSTAATVEQTSEGKKVRIRKVDSQKSITIADEDRVSRVILSPDGQTLITGRSSEPILTLWNTTSGERLRSFVVGFPQALAFTDGGKVLIDIDGHGLNQIRGASIRTLDLATGKQEQVEFPLAKTSEATDGVLIAAAVAPGGKTAAIADLWRPTISLLAIPSGRNEGDLPDRDSVSYLSPTQTTLVFSADGKFLAAGRNDGVVTLWNVALRRKLWAVPGHSNDVPLLSFSSNGKILASVGKDEIIKLWDVATGKELATVVAPSREDWLVVTPDGLFDGAPASWSKMLWRFAGNTFDFAPAEAFFSEFYYPNLLNDILDGTRPHAPDISQKDRRQPHLTLTYIPVASVPSDETAAEKEPPPDKTTGDRPVSRGQLADIWRRVLQGKSKVVKERFVKVKIEISQAPAGAQDVRLFRNGSLVRVWRGDVLNGQSSVSLEVTVPTVSNTNQLTAYAFNRDNIKSPDATLSFFGVGKRGKGTAYIIDVGVNEYANPQYNLKYAVADAQEFAEELQRQQAKLENYRVEVMSLHDKDATKANILKSITDLSAKVQPEDAVIIYFAGHGTAHGNLFYLIPHDLGYTGNRNLLDNAGLQNILSHSISDQEIETAVENIDAGNLLLVIDACNSGQALEAEEKRKGPMNSKGLAQLAFEKGMYILTAAQSYQAALEASRLGHGYLTYALVEEGLKANMADREPRDGQVMIREWLDFATDRVPQMQQETIEEQHKQGRQLEQVIKFAEADAGAERRVQRPRVFYRRETEPHSLVVARP